MKLLLCPDCYDVFKLSYALRQCECGRVKGRYDENGSTAVSNGKGYSLALGNGSVMMAIEAARSHRDATDNKAGRDEYYRSGKGKIEYAWARPNDGPGNPHSRIEEDL